MAAMNSAPLPLLAATLLLLLSTHHVHSVRVLLYRNAAAAFMQWDSRRPTGWSPPTSNSTWPATDHSEAALGYIDGSLYVVGGERWWSTRIPGQTSRSGTPLYRQHKDSPTRLVKEVPLANGTAKPGPPLAVARVWPTGGKGVTTAGNTRLAVCGSGEYAPDSGESSCEVLTSERLDSDGHQWMFFSLPEHMCGKNTAATGGHSLGQHGIVVAGGRCRNGTTSAQVVLIDLSTGSVHRLPPMRHARAGHSVTALADRLVACGGELDEEKDSWQCEQLVLTAAGDGGLAGTAASAANATWQYIEHIPPNAAATSEPAARVRHIVAVGPNRLMAIISGGGVFFWRAGEGAGAWSGGPGLPYSADNVGVTVIHDEEQRGESEPEECEVEQAGCRCVCVLECGP